MGKFNERAGPKNVGNRHKNTVKFQSIHHSAHGRKELSCSALHQLHMRRIKGHKVVNPRLQMNEEEILINWQLLVSLPR